MKRLGTLAHSMRHRLVHCVCGSVTPFLCRMSPDSTVRIGLTSFSVDELVDNIMEVMSTSTHELADTRLHRSPTCEWFLQQTGHARDCKAHPEKVEGHPSGALEGSVAFTTHTLTYDCAAHATCALTQGHHQLLRPLPSHIITYIRRLTQLPCQSTLPCLNSGAQTMNTFLQCQPLQRPLAPSVAEVPTTTAAMTVAQRTTMATTVLLPLLCVCTTCPPALMP